ncbi:MAG: sel1 repeat family protein [Alphaproteobacteria bacterium]|nr:sel1 repeat family protein [Alphaproteobacteria bacterium]
MRRALLAASLVVPLAACGVGLKPTEVQDQHALAARAADLGDFAPLYDYYRGVALGAASSSRITVADAMRRLGDFHAEGRAVPQDFGVAAKWYRDAAERGREATTATARDAKDSHWNWGHYLSARLTEQGGPGLGAKPEEAARLYRVCAEGLLALCQDRLGDLFAEGRGVAKDAAQAITWWRLAAEERQTGTPTPLANRAREKLVALEAKEKK